MEDERLGHTGSIEGPTPSGARVEAFTLAAAIVVGAQALWLVVPTGTLWVLSRVIHSTAEYLFIALMAVPVAVATFACLLTAANRRYLRLASRGDGRGPLEAVLPATIILAFLGAAIWFIFFANHLPAGREQMIP